MKSQHVLSDGRENNSQWKKKKSWEFYSPLIVSTKFLSFFPLPGSPATIVGRLVLRSLSEWALTCLALSKPGGPGLDLCTQAMRVCFGNRPWIGRICWLARRLEREDSANPYPSFLSVLGSPSPFSWKLLGRLPLNFLLSILCMHIYLSGFTWHISYSLVSFWVIGVCLIFLIEWKPVPCGNRILQFSSVFPATLSLILCGLESIYEGLFTALLWRMVAVRWSFHFVEILAKPLKFSAPHFINIKNNHNDAFSNVLWKLMDN